LETILQFNLNFKFYPNDIKSFRQTLDCNPSDFGQYQVIDARTGQEVTDDAEELEDWVSDYDKFRVNGQDWAKEYMDLKGIEKVQEKLTKILVPVNN
jgi:hypothetical protein